MTRHLVCKGLKDCLDVEGSAVNAPCRAQSSKGALKNRRPLVRKCNILYWGQGMAECGSTVSFGKLKAPSIALEVCPISNHCSNGIFCG